jgi:hypothetical protein
MKRDGDSKQPENIRSMRRHATLNGCQWTRLNIVTPAFARRATVWVGQMDRGPRWVVVSP